MRSLRPTIAFILNLPWTFLGALAALISIPTSIRIHRQPFAILMTIKSFWWQNWRTNRKGSRALTIGQLICLGSQLLDHRDLQHELIHVEQAIRAPLVQPLLYAWESHRHGYRQNKYEVEAYTRSGSLYKTN